MEKIYFYNERILNSNDKDMMLYSLVCREKCYSCEHFVDSKELPPLNWAMYKLPRFDSLSSVK